MTEATLEPYSAGSGLRSWPAFRTFLVFFAIQFGAAIVFGIAAGISQGVQFGTLNPALLTTTIGPVGTLFGYLIAGIWILRSFLRQANTRNLSGALLGDAPAASLRALAAGVALGCLYLVAVALLAPHDTEIERGPMATLAVSGWVGQVCWVLIALAAPLFEEVLFRGLLFPAFTLRLGLVAGALASTTLFFAVHLPDTIHFWPAAVAVFGVGMAACYSKVHSRGLLPCVALHLGYNTVVILALTLSSATS